MLDLKSNYIEVVFNANDDKDVNSLLKSCYHQLHLCFVSIKDRGSQPVGVAFPQYSQEEKTLGSVIRLHGNMDDLKRLQLEKVLAEYQPAIQLSSIQSTPRTIEQHVTYKRIQPRASKERILRRQMKRQGVTQAVVEARYKDYQATPLSLPCIELHSHSNKCRFPLFIEKIVSSEPRPGLFNTYGLSAKTTVPHF